MNQPQSLKVYGITACDTVKKARVWLSVNAVAHHYVDFKKTPPTSDQVKGWLASVPWEQLINRKGTTWRKLPTDTQTSIDNQATALALALAHPSVIKRPVVEWPDGKVSVGFDALTWAKRCGVAR